MRTHSLRTRTSNVAGVRSLGLSLPRRMEAAEDFSHDGGFGGHNGDGFEGALAAIGARCRVRRSLEKAKRLHPKRPGVRIGKCRLGEGSVWPLIAAQSCFGVLESCGSMEKTVHALHWAYRGAGPKKALASACPRRYPTVENEGSDHA